MATKLLTLYSQFANKSFEKHDDDDLVDKISRKFSTIMMFIFVIIVTTYELVGNPIQCWCPNGMLKQNNLIIKS